MPSQVTDVIGPKRGGRAAQGHIPLWLKIAWTVFVLVWAPLYWRQYGPQNFLFYCDLGNLLIMVGLWLESRLILSWQAVGLLVFQSLYAVDLLGALLLRRHAFGGTEYMFDPGIPVFIRALGLYHLSFHLCFFGPCDALGTTERLEVADRPHGHCRSDQLLLASGIQRELRPRDRTRTAHDAGLAIPDRISDRCARSDLLADAHCVTAVGG